MKNRSWCRAVLFAGVVSLTSGLLPSSAMAAMNERGDNPRTEWILQRQSSRLEAARQEKYDRAEAERIRLEKMESERDQAQKENSCQNC